jgi:esterase/lipase superfamily enzyme
MILSTWVYNPPSFNLFKVTSMRYWLFALFILFSRFAFSQEIPTPTPPASSTRDYYPVISLMYGTDRVCKNGRFTGDRSPRLSLGVAQVVLHLHYLRHSDRVCAWWRLGGSAEHVTGLLATQPLDEADFGAPLRSSADTETFIFVHGFSRTFDEGSQEAAQIAYDLQLPGMPVLYSWPSQGRLSPGGYQNDLDMVNRPETINDLVTFIEKVLRSSPRGRKVHLVGFSMGTYLLTRALVQMTGQKKDLSPIGEVLLLSADIDAGDFKTLYYPKLKKALEGHMVLYVSGRDEALVFSQAIHHGKPRLGEGGAEAMALDGVTAIDATQSSLDCGICHGLFRVNGVINDIYLALHQRLPPGKRLLDPSGEDGKSTYALFDKSHDIVTLQDHNFAIAGQLGTYMTTFKLIWLPDPALEVAAGNNGGFLPREIEFRWNLLTGNWRPYLDAGLDYYDQGGGQTAWATQEGLGLEFAFDSGLGLGLEWDGISELGRSSPVAAGSSLDSLLKNNDFPWGGFRLQLIQYFDLHNLFI